MNCKSPRWFKECWQWPLLFFTTQASSLSVLVYVALEHICAPPFKIYIRNKLNKVIVKTQKYNLSYFNSVPLSDSWSFYYPGMLYLCVVLEACSNRYQSVFSICLARAKQRVTWENSEPSNSLEAKECHSEEATPDYILQQDKQISTQYFISYITLFVYSLT